ncbi:MAG TPA: HAD-IA family hydrolase [Thermoanaerobaculia bacterium]|jgi:putative hydrolase of the HAD superfamily|nr:HAD-IA family hydrolase [Thermoanaerobaculia bacterium]
MIEAVTFDVTHTLVHCPRLGNIYSEVLGRHGIEVAPAEALRLIGVVWREMACSADPSRDRFSAHPEGPRGWWRRFLCRFCEHLEAPPPSPFAAAELFHRFGGGEAWEVYPEVPGVLDALRERGLRLGVISNWDTRLPEVLRQLDLARRFEVVVYSSAVGVEKPDSRIFRRALRELGVEPRAALHVGDSRLEDLEGAIAAGLRALLLVRGGRDAAAARAGTARKARELAGLHDLSPLPALVTAGAARGGASR